MARRYSGTLMFTIRLQSDSESYSVRINELNDDARFETLNGIKLSPAMRARVAADSALSYDEVARAAISFAGADDDAVYAYAATDSDGTPLVRRTRRIGG